MANLILSAYYNDEEFFNKNFINLPKIKSLFSEARISLTIKPKAIKFVVKNTKSRMASIKCYEIATGEEVKINKGGFSGMTLWISRKEEGYSSFLCFSGIGVNGASVSSGAGVGISLNTGSINRIESNLALAFT